MNMETLLRHADPLRSIQLLSIDAHLDLTNPSGSVESEGDFGPFIVLAPFYGQDGNFVLGPTHPSTSSFDASQHQVLA